VRRPVIGICASLVQARWSVWDAQVHLTPRSYCDAVRLAGGLPVLLPAGEPGGDEPDALLDLVDGVILAGGADVDPAVYGAEVHPETVGTVPEQDRFEVALTRRAIERDLPLLGICRGMQLLNVACGGTLIQHLPERFGHHEHRRELGTFDNADHDVRVQEGSLAHRATGEALHGTKSHHHQGVEALGEGLVASGWAVGDDLVETVEMPGRDFVLGVQWHPEADARSRVVAALVEAARLRQVDAHEVGDVQPLG
jgi:putative glutamine amidotransferase